MTIPKFKLHKLKAEATKVGHSWDLLHPAPVHRMRSRGDRLFRDRVAALKSTQIVVGRNAILTRSLGKSEAARSGQSLEEPLVAWIWL